jgi:hypothetical protein
MDFKRIQSTYVSNGPYSDSRAAAEAFSSLQLWERAVSNALGKLFLYMHLPVGEDKVLGLSFLARADSDQSTNTVTGHAQRLELERLTL